MDNKLDNNNNKKERGKLVINSNYKNKYHNDFNNNLSSFNKIINQSFKNTNISNNLSWISYCNLSCRYDSFFYIYSNIIFYYIISLNKTDNIKYLDIIAKKF